MFNLLVEEGLVFDQKGYKLSKQKYLHDVGNFYEELVYSFINSDAGIELYKNLIQNIGGQDMLLKFHTFAKNKNILEDVSTFGGTLQSGRHSILKILLAILSNEGRFEYSKLKNIKIVSPIVDIFVRYIKDGEIFKISDNVVLGPVNNNSEMVNSTIIGMLDGNLGYFYKRSDIEKYSPKLDNDFIKSMAYDEDPLVEDFENEESFFEDFENEDPFFEDLENKDSFLKILKTKTH
jgi:hypothetical protein